MRAKFSLIALIALVMGVGALIMRSVDPAAHPGSALWSFGRAALLTALAFAASASLPRLLPGGWTRFPIAAWALYGLGIGAWLAFVLPLSLWGEPTVDPRLVFITLAATAAFFAIVGSRLRQHLRQEA